LKEILYEKTEQSLLEKECDPRKATMLAQWSAADHSGSLRNDTETLYVAKNGEYFIVYEGGLGSGFHTLPGVATWFGGTYTRTISPADAHAWCQETGNYDALSSHAPFCAFSLCMKQ